MIKDGLFTSESVADGHPDKICDQISDAILDACLAQDPCSRVAVEVAIKGKTLCLLGEISSSANIDPAQIARVVLVGIGHQNGLWGLDPASLLIVEDITRQSLEIKSGVDGLETGAGDQGIMFGYACDETPSYMPLPISLAHALTRRHRDFRQTEAGKHLGPDAKSQVTVIYRNGQAVGLDTIVFSSQHSKDIKLDALQSLIQKNILKPVLRRWLTPEVKVHINPAGTFIIGGPVADAGLTGRKIIVDSYGGIARHGGGAYSGKDPTKVDRSAAYAARQIARDVVARGWARACEFRVAYAIGVAKPVDVSFETFDTDQGASPAERYLAKNIDLTELMTPHSIIERLQLHRPIYQNTAAFGHFGRSEFSWEQPLISAPHFL